MVDPTHAFHIADYVVFGATIVISIAIGIFYATSGGRQRTTSEYLVGGRTMQFIPVAISLMVSFESSIMMLGLPAEMYVYGVQWWISCVGFMISQALSVFVMVPLLHPLKITSAYEYLHLRFNSTAVRLLGTFLGMLTYTWYMGIVLFGPAIALEAVTGFPQWSSIFVIAFVAVIYTSIGGLKAVIWTDVFQAFVMYAGMASILIKGTIDVGGPRQVWDIANQGGRLQFFNFDPDPTVRHTFWNLFVGAIIRGFGLAFNQSTVQRVSATKSLREAKTMVNVTIPFFFLTLTMACYEGIIAYSYYHIKGCDPLGSKKITNPNQIIPYTVMDIFQHLPGMPGLFLASLFSASLSTLSSGLSSLSALLWADILKPRVGDISELKATIIAKVSVFVFGLLSCAVAMIVSLIGGPLTQIAGSLLSAFGGPLTGLFLLGCFCPWANAKGALFGGILSLLFSSWLSLGMNFTKSIKATPWLPPASMEYCSVNSTRNTANLSAFAAAWLGDSGYNATYITAVFNLFNASLLNSSDFISTTMSSAMIRQGPQGIEKMYTLSYQWLAPVGILLTLIAGSIVSFVTGGNKPGEVHPRYLMSFFDHMCWYLPESVLKRLRCGEDYTSADNEDYEPPAKFAIMNTEIIITQDDDDKNDEKKTLTDKEGEADGHVTGSDAEDDSRNPESSKLNGSPRPLASFLSDQEACDSQPAVRPKNGGKNSHGYLPFPDPDLDNTGDETTTLARSDSENTRL